jgi:hypothetical protein
MGCSSPDLHRILQAPSFLEPFLGQLPLIAWRYDSFGPSSGGPE